ncbi:MAG: glycosyltransferase family 4 protein [Vicinamibacteria bacterium]|nr:glycosyltransferase family 4 protein [Vicinamibacteria bacterium]
MTDGRRRLRVCFVANGRTPHGVTRAEALAAQGVDVRFVTIGPVLPTTLAALSTPLPRGPLSALRAFAAFFRDIRSFEPDLLHLHYAGGRLGTLAHLSAVHPLVVSVIGGDVLPEQHEGGLPEAERRATGIILEDADLILAKSDHLKSRVLEMGPFASKTEVVRWGIDASIFRRDDAGRARLRARFGCADSDRIILSPRGLQPLYNIDLIVEAFARVARNDPFARLAITETGASPAYAAALRTQIASLGIENRVQFWGRFDRSELPALYSAADVAVSVPRSDGLPQSLFEAMACETPTILGDLAAYKELAAPGEGVLYSEIQADALAAILASVSPEELRALGARGRQRILGVADLSAEAKRVVAFYEQLAARPRRRRRPRVSEALSLLPRSL